MEITTQVGCRVSCTYCPQSTFVKRFAERSKQRKMSFDLFAQCLDKMPSEVRIHFTGMSEPFLNPDCIRMIQYAHDKGHEIMVSTTVVGLTQEIIETLKSLSIAPFVVHLPSAEGFEKIVVDDDYVALIRSLLESDIVNEWHCHGTLHPALEAVVGEVPYVPARQRAGNARLTDAPAPVTKKGHIRCTRGLNHNVLLPNGDVALCCVDYGLRHVLGNLVEDDYEALFKGPGFASVRRGLRRSSPPSLCRVCEHAVETGVLHLARRAVRAAPRRMRALVHRRA